MKRYLKHEYKRTEPTACSRRRRFGPSKYDVVEKYQYFRNHRRNTFPDAIKTRHSDSSLRDSRLRYLLNGRRRRCHYRRRLCSPFVFSERIPWTTHPLKTLGLFGISTQSRDFEPKIGVNRTVTLGLTWFFNGTTDETAYWWTREK